MIKGAIYVSSCSPYYLAPAGSAALLCHAGNRYAQYSSPVKRHPPQNKVSCRFHTEKEEKERHLRTASKQPASRTHIEILPPLIAGAECML